MPTGPEVVTITVDLASEMAVVRLSDGTRRTTSVDGSRFDASSRVLRLTYTPAFDWLVAVTTTGDTVRFELPSPASPAPLDGRVVVYLDQNQWSAITNARYAPSRVPEPDRVAALNLARLVDDGLVVLPASAAHYVETTVWADTERRYLLGLPVLQLSRGWQMRHPLDLRREEFADLLAGREPDLAGSTAEPVFTLAPGRLLSPDAPLSI